MFVEARASTDDEVHALLQTIIGRLMKRLTRRGVRVDAHDRKRLQQLCRYITGPALSAERVQLNTAGQAELRLKTPWRDGGTHRVMSPPEFIQRLVVPQGPPGQHFTA